MSVAGEKKGGGPPRVPVATAATAVVTAVPILVITRRCSGVFTPVNVLGLVIRRGLLCASYDF